MRGLTLKLYQPKVVILENLLTMLNTSPSCVLVATRAGADLSRTMFMCGADYNCGK